MAEERVRGPDYASGSLTPEEEAQMAEHVKLWTARALRTEPIEAEKIVPALQNLYRAADLKAVPVVITTSPMAMALAGGFAAGLWHCLENNELPKGDSGPRVIAASIRVATDRALKHISGQSLEFQMPASTLQEIAASTIRATREAVTPGVPLSADLSGGRANSELVGFLLSCASRSMMMYQGGNMWASWECYLTACRDILGLRLKEFEKYAPWEQAAIHGGFRIMHERFCIVSDFPEALRIDDQNQPHCDFGPSHRWRDGWSLYHWHGIRIPATWIEEKEKLAPETALKWDNVEQRRAAGEIIGMHRVLDLLNCKVIDQHPNPEVGTLVEADIPEIGRERFLRVRCGTGREFALCVPPDTRSALEAQSWGWGKDPDDFVLPEVRT